MYDCEPEKSLRLVYEVFNLAILLIITKASKFKNDVFQWVEQEYSQQRNA